MGSRLAATWLVMIVLHVACGRFGFEEQHGATVADARIDVPDAAVATGDAGRDAGGDAPAVLDANPADADAIGACGYTTCGPGKVTCCDSGAPACVPDGAACGRRFECEQPTNTGCTGGLMCCLTMDSTGTECVDVLTQPCFG